MDKLFSSNERVKQLKNAPLAVRMRPSTLDDYVGQKKAVGPGSWLRSAIEHDVLVIFQQRARKTAQERTACGSHAPVDA